MKASNINIGCSSYYNFRWTEVFYPADIGRNKWFEYYCQHFNTYEINGTFYKFPTVKSLQTWYKKAPEGFMFALKVPKVITHIKRLEDCEQELAAFYSVCQDGLADKLGPILFQFPPSFSYTAERLELLLKAVDTRFKNAIEFRTESWWQRDVYDALAAKNIAFASVNYPKLPTTIITTNKLAYIRFHGNPRLFYSEYSTAELQATLKELIAKKNVSEAYIFFNNTASTAAIVNAVELKASISKR